CRRSGGTPGQAAGRELPSVAHSSSGTACSRVPGRQGPVADDAACRPRAIHTLVKGEGAASDEGGPTGLVLDVVGRHPVAKAGEDVGSGHQRPFRDQTRRISPTRTRPPGGMTLTGRCGRSPSAHEPKDLWYCIRTLRNLLKLSRCFVDITWVTTIE